MDLNHKTCLVTGGAGFIGSHVVDLLVRRCRRVRVLDNLSNGKLDNIAHHLKSDRLEFIKGSVTDPLDVEHALKQMDVVFHMACLGVRHSIAHPFENQRVNGEGTLLLLDAARRARLDRFIHCSSSEVYGTALWVPIAESHPTSPCTIYGGGKLAGEAYSRAYWNTYNLPVVILRPFNTYGPRSHHEGDAGEMIPRSIVRALNGRPLRVFGDGGQTRDFTYVEDTALAIVEAAEPDETVGQTINIGSGFEISIGALAEKIIDLVGHPASRIEYAPPRPGDVLRLHADCRKLTRYLDWKPKTDLDAGLMQTIDYFRRHSSGIECFLQNEMEINWNILLKPSP